MAEEKPEHRERRRDEKGGGEGMEEKWRRDPISGVVFGLIVLALGVLLTLAARNVISWDDWWKYFLIGIGVAFLIEVAVRRLNPAYRRPMFGRFVAGLVLICIGAASVGGFGTWWPLIIVAIAVAILVRLLLFRKTG
jgi:hypothetical protein